MDAAALPRADETRVAVIGLGYVGLPLAVAFGRKYTTVGFDINKARVDELRQHRDHTLEVSAEELKAAANLSIHSDPAELRNCDIFVVTVPTPIDEFKRPDLHAARIGERHASAARSARAASRSTNRPCIPARPKKSACRSSSASPGLKHNVDFYAGYSPERINPGDKQHRLETIVKVTSGSTPEAADFVDALYRGIVDGRHASAHRASASPKRRR